MENASKALLISAGILMTLLIITLLVVFYNEVSSYYAFKHNMAETEQLQEFNSVYQNYQNKEIRGNELISIMNRIIDYNNLQAGQKGYERIIINVDLKGYAGDLTSSSEVLSEDEKLFDDQIINTTNDTAIKKVAELPIKLISTVEIRGITDLKLQKLSSEIHNIVLGNNPTDEEKSERAKKLKLILGYEPTDDEIIKIVEATKKYDQLTQFKRTMFECKEVSVDTDTKRVNRMEFEAVVVNGQLKMD